MLQSGKVTVSANSIDALEIKAENKKIDIKALNKEFIKNTLAATSQPQENKGIRESIKGTVNQLKTARSNLSMLKGVAEELSEAGITVTLTYKEKVVVTMGSEANPKLSSIATGTKAIEINNPRKLIELGI
jgi:gas vesicle protein